jgi:PAS domain S-box-containing protein
LIERSVRADRFPDGVFSVSRTLGIDFCNDSMLRLTGHARDELVGAPAEKVISPEVRRTDDDGRVLRLGEHLAELTATPQAELGARDALRFVGPIRHASGVEIEVGWLVLPLGAVEARAVVSVHGLADPLRVADEARGATPADDRLHQIVFENAPIGIFHFDERGIVTACNDQFVAIIGSSRRHLIGLDTRTLPDPEIHRCVGEALAGRRASYVGDYRSNTAQKTTPVAVDFAPIFARDGTLAGGVALVKDVTERRDAERLVARAERMASLGALAAGMVHEIQNPLAFTVTSLDVVDRLLEAPLDPAKLTELRVAVASAREGALRVSNIARDLKTFARADDDRHTAVDVTQAMESALKLVAPQLKVRATLVTRFSPVPRVRGNEHRLVQLFVNLLVNAAESFDTRDQGEHRVTVSVDTTGEGGARIVVEDTGRGLPATEPSRVFEPFFTNKPSGMGLGLAICHGIVSSFGGEIFHEPPSGPGGGPARGTRMVVLLPPFEERPPTPRPPRTSTVPPPRPTDRRSDPGPRDVARGRVLVIDDEERLAATLRLALSPAHDVDVATSGRAGRDAVLAGDYDVVLCDLFLPDLSGPEIFDDVVASRPELGGRFVFLTGGAFTDAARSFLRRVPNARLEKPFDLGTLEALIADLLATRRLGGGPPTGGDA